MKDRTSSRTVTYLPCLEGGGVLGADLLDGEGQVGGSQEEEAKSPEPLEEEGVSCTLDHQALGTYNLKGENSSVKSSSQRSFALPQIYS